MSYGLRHLLSQCSYRRGKRQALVKGLICYADDFILVGRWSQLRKAIKASAAYFRDVLGLTIKPAWRVCHFPALKAKQPKAPCIDTLGYCIRRDHVRHRGRCYRLLRRQILRGWRELKTMGYVPWWRAQSIMCRWAQAKHSDSRRIFDKYQLKTLLRQARRSLSYYGRLQAARAAA